MAETTVEEGVPVENTNTDNADNPSEDETAPKETITIGSEETPQNLEESKAIAEEKDTPIQEPSNETSVTNNQDTNIEKGVVIGQSHTTIPIDQPTEEAVSQDTPNITNSALECKASNDDQNLYSDFKDVSEKESNITSDQQEGDLSENSDCQIITEHINTVDLTVEDSLIQESCLGQSDFEVEPKIINHDLRDEAETVESGAKETPTEQQPLSSENENEPVSLQIVDQNNTELSSQQEPPLAQANSEVEPENLNQEKPRENESLKDQQVELSKSDSTLNQYTIPDHDKIEDISRENYEVNESSTDQSNLEVESEVVHQVIEEDVLLMEESNAYESSNDQPTAHCETKIYRTTNTSNIIVLASKDTTKKNKEKRCFKCHDVGHFKNQCLQVKGPLKREGDKLAEAPLAKKKKIWRIPPADLAGFIAQHTQHITHLPPWQKLKLIKECTVLRLNPIPKSWTHCEMITFMKENVQCVHDNANICFYFFVRDMDFNTTGECLVKFKLSRDCQSAWFNLRGIKIDGTLLYVNLDLGHRRMKEVRKTGKLRMKHMNPQQEEPTKNNNEFITQKHADVNNQVNKNVASTSDANKSTADSIIIDVDSFNGSDTSSVVASNNVANNSQATNYSPNQTGGEGTSSGMKKPYYKLSYMPAEKFENTTYGLNEEFLKSLGLNMPLSNVVIAIGLDLKIDDNKIKEIFSLAGTVKKAFRVLKKDGTPTWKAVVEYDHPVEAVQAISMLHGKQLYNHNLILKMPHKTFPRALPEGLTEVGPGLGVDGAPMKGIRALIELQALKKTLTEFKNVFDSKIKEIEKDIAAINNKIVPEPQPPKNNPTTTPQSLPSDAATQLANALSSLAQPNILMGLNTLLSTQGYLQQGMGTDQAAMVNSMQNQMMMQNAYAPNVNMQSMTPQPTLPGVYPQPGLAQPQLIQPMDQTQMVPMPHVSQPYYAQAHVVQQTYAPMQPGPPPAPTAPVPQATAPQPAYANHVQLTPGSTTHPSLSQPSSGFSQAKNQQTPAYTPKPPAVEGPSKNQLSGSKWDKTPVAGKKQKAPEPKPTFLAETSNYKRPTRFDVKATLKPNLKVIETEPETKNDMLVFSNLPPSVTVHALNSKMKEVGEVVFGEMTGRGRAVVRFKHGRDAERCIKLFNRSKVDGQVINVEYF